MTTGEFRSEARPFLTNKLVKELIQNCFLETEITKLLEKEGIIFSPESVRNIFFALLIFREIPRDASLLFFIYGSTAKGIAGLEPKVQEIQFWQHEDYLGSAFRRYGESDLDLRCISEDPEVIYRNLQKCRDKFAPYPFLKTSVRIENYECVWKEIMDQTRPSFYRRIFILNKPIILSGEERFNEFVKRGSVLVTPQDINYEIQRRQLKSFVVRHLEHQNIIFLPQAILTGMFPTYCEPANLRNKNLMRQSSLKVTFGELESSLITVMVKNPEEVNEYLTGLT